MTKDQVKCTLSNAIREHDYSAIQIAQNMGPQAMPILEALLAEPDNAIHLRVVQIASTLPLSISHELLFKAVESENAQLSLQAIDAIEKQQHTLSSNLFVALLDRLLDQQRKKNQQIENIEVVNQVIIILGKKLSLGDSQAIKQIEKYCKASYDAIFVLHCIAALAKIGETRYREQFSAYIQSLKDNTDALRLVFELIKYINQPWLASALKSQLNNQHVLFKLSQPLPRFPSAIRVCDIATIELANLLSLRLPFITGKHKNYTSEELQKIYKVVNSQAL